MGKFEFVVAGGSGHLPSRKIDNLLISALNARNIKKTEEWFQEAHVQKKFVDSGGFQLVEADEANNKIMEAMMCGDNVEDKIKELIFNKPLTPKKNTNSQIIIYPELVVDVASKLNADFLIGLDFPLRNVKKGYPQYKEYLRKAGFNITWAREISPLYELYCPDTTKLLLPLQCFNLQQLEWYCDSIQGVKYDGFSVIGRNITPCELLLFLVRLYKMGEKTVHVLGTSSFAKIAVMAYMARHCFDWLSFDAKSWLEHGKFHKYLDPNNLKIYSVGDGYDVPEGKINDCPCPWCKRGKSFVYIKNMDDRDRRNFLLSHNCWVTEKVKNDLYDNAVNTHTLIQYIRKVKVQPKVVNVLSRLLPMVECYLNTQPPSIEALEQRLLCFK